MFQDNPQETNNFLKGLIKDGANFPFDSVQDCLNLDFYPNRTEKRPPYVFQKEIAGLSNYSLIGVYNKRFTDYGGTTQEVFVSVFRRNSVQAGERNIRIFLDYDYRPTTTFGNSRHTTAGWTSDSNELTEQLTLANTVTLTPNSEGVLLVATTVTSKPNGYYKGFFVNQGHIKGIVTKYEESAGSSYFYISLNQKVTNVFLPIPHNLITPSSISLDTLASTTTYKLLSVIIATYGAFLSSMPSLKIGGIIPTGINCQVGLAIGGKAAIIANSLSIDGDWISSNAVELGEQAIMIRKTGEILEIIQTGHYNSMIANGSGVISMAYLENPDIPDADITVSGLHLTNIEITNSYIGGHASTPTPTIEGNKIGFPAELSDAVYQATTTLNTEVSLVRYPVFAQLTDIENITEVTFVEQSQAIKFVCGHECEILRLDFLQEKKYFGTKYGALTPTDYTFNPHWDGFWFSVDAIDVPEKSSPIIIAAEYWGNTTTSIWYPQVRMDGKILKYQSAGQLYFFTNNDQSVSSSEGNPATFFNNYEMLGILTRTQFAPNMNYLHLGDFNVYGNAINYSNQLYGLGIETDGYQLNMLRTFITQRFYCAAAGFYYCSILPQFSILYNTNFNRRISATKLFYDRNNNGYLGDSAYSDSEVTFKNNNPFLLAEQYGGDVKVTKNGETYAKVEATSGTVITYYLQVINAQRQGVENSSKSGDHWLNNAYLEAVDADIESVSEYALNPENNGLSLNAYLNNYYYKDIKVKADKLITVDDVNVAINLSNDVVATDPVNDRNGQFKIGINQQQQGLLSCDSIWGDERVQQISNSEELIGGAGMVNGEFLLFTERELFYYRIADFTKGFLQLQRKYNVDMATANAIVEAKYESDYAGIYWVGKNSIYRFLDNYPEDLLDGRWKKYFQESIPLADKQGAIGYYYPRTKEIHFVIGSSIYIWNIVFQHWKIYSYSDVPQRAVRSYDEEILFMNSNKIFKTYPTLISTYKIGETSYEIYGDKRTSATTLTAIDFKFGKELANSNERLSKVLDRVELVYKQTSIAESSAGLILSGTYNQSLNYSSFTDGNLNFIINFITNPRKKNIQVRFRPRITRCYLEINSTYAGSIKTFELFQYFVNFKLSGRPQTRI